MSINVDTAGPRRPSVNGAYLDRLERGLTAAFLTAFCRAEKGGSL